MISSGTFLSGFAQGIEGGVEVGEVFDLHRTDLFQSVTVRWHGAAADEESDFRWQ